MVLPITAFGKCLDTMYTVPGKITKYFHTDLELTVGKYLHMQTKQIMIVSLYYNHP